MNILCSHTSPYLLVDNPPNGVEHWWLYNYGQIGIELSVYRIDNPPPYQIPKDWLKQYFINLFGFFITDI